ncbi:MAG: topoisomerase C-terminal repeat-containing protein, partial [Candidatus Puniceispirillum sp.]
LLAEAAKKAGRLLGQHPDGGDIHLKAGRFGPYVEHNKLRATLGKAHDMAELTLETALALLAAKVAKGGTKKTAAKKTATKQSAKKAAPKKAATKKAATQKTTSAGKSD